MVSSTELDSLLSILREKLQSRKAVLADKSIRTLFSETIAEVLRERFGMSEDEVKTYIYVEGCLGKILPNEGGKVFGSRLYPDAIIRFDDGLKVAVELDWGNKNRGSKLKNALAKSGMLKLTGNFHRVAVFFFLNSPIELTSIEQRVLKFYREDLFTWLILV